MEPTKKIQIINNIKVRKIHNIMKLNNRKFNSESKLFIN